MQAPPSTRLSFEQVIRRAVFLLCAHILGYRVQQLAHAVKHPNDHPHTIRALEALVPHVFLTRGRAIGLLKTVLAIDGSTAIFIPNDVDMQAFNLHFRARAASCGHETFADAYEKLRALAQPPETPRRSAGGLWVGWVPSNTKK